MLDKRVHLKEEVRSQIFCRLIRQTHLITAKVSIQSKNTASGDNPLLITVDKSLALRLGRDEIRLHTSFMLPMGSHYSMTPVSSSSDLTSLEISNHKIFG